MPRLQTIKQTLTTSKHSIEFTYSYFPCHFKVNSDEPALTFHQWPPPHPRTNTGKQMFSYQAIDLWRDIPYFLKDLSTFSFAKEIKHYLLSEQYSKKFV